MLINSLNIRNKNLNTITKAVAEVFNQCFNNSVSQLQIHYNNDFETEFIGTIDPTLNAINKSENHSSIIMIKKQK